MARARIIVAGPSVDGPRFPEVSVASEEIPVKIPDDVLRGVYANQMMVRHSREEFVLDFVSLFPPGGIVNARVVVSPAHLKRMIRALQENLTRYESRFGPVLEAEPPRDSMERN